MQMGLPFLNGVAGKKRNQIMSVDLGGRTTKAILVERQGDGFALTRYALLDAPIFEKTLSPELLAEHLKAVFETLGSKTKFTTLSIGVNDALVRPLELPQIPIDEMRLVLKNNTRGYLQQDLPNRVFDCAILPTKAPLKSADAPKASAIPKVKVLVTAAKKDLVDDFQNAIKDAGLVADHIVPALIGPVNAFEMAMPEIFANDSVALVDIGFKNSTISLLHQGELVLSRVVAIGGDKLTAGLAEAMNISYAEAEGIKI